MRIRFLHTSQNKKTVNYTLLMNFLLLTISLLVSSFSTAQEIAINEIMASNSKTISDNYGDYEDWIEIFNYGSEPVNLENYGLSDDPGNLFRWVFPPVVVEPGDYLLVWASGKDIKPQNGMVHGVMREVYSGISGHSVHHLTNHPNYPDNPCNRHLVSGGFDAPVDVADYYGQRMHAYLEAPETGYYLFWIASDDNGILYLSTDDNPDNAEEIARVPGWTHHMEWDKYAAQQSDAVWLKEGDLYYIKALMKEHEGGDNLSVRWKRPSGITEAPIPNDFLFWDETELHTNFRIDREGEEVVLTHHNGTVIDSCLPVPVPTDISYGRKPDGTGNWYYFNHPTPGAPNDTEAYDGIMDPPYFSSPGGFYREGFDLTLHHRDEGVSIVYTLDGSEPDKGNLDGSVYRYRNRYRQYQHQSAGALTARAYISRTYNGAIAVKNRTGTGDSQAGINTRWTQNPITPSASPPRGTVVRARAYKEGYIPSDIVSGTYIIRDEPYPIPVVSLVLPEASFFDYDTGIYVAGRTFDQWRAQNWHAGIGGASPANFNMRGSDWERETNFEFFDKTGKNILNHRAGVRIHGGWSRSFPQKSLRLYARGGYGTYEFEHQLFPSKSAERFKRFMMRASGNDHDLTFFRDALIQQMVINRPIDMQHWEPVLTFLNGEFWGILNMRDRFDKYYLHYKYGVDPEQVDLLTNNAVVKVGDNQHYNAMMRYAEDHDLSDPDHYRHMNTLMDIDNFAEYYAIQIYARNTDWPGNNIDFWRHRTDGYVPDAPCGHDGRWRWMLFDLDFGFGIWNHGPWHNTLEFAAEAHGPGWPNPPWSTSLFRNLLGNQDFRNMMANRLADMMNGPFYPDSVRSKIDQMQERYAPVIAEQIDRWTLIGSVNSWNNNVNVMRDFAERRPDYVKEHVQSFFDLAGNYNLTVGVGSGKGSIRVSTLNIDNPSSWSGTYFHDVPVDVEAIADNNYRFSHWEGGSDSTSERITVNTNDDIALKAHFVKAADPILIAFWVFDTSMPNNTPLEAISDTHHALNPAIISFYSALDGYPFSSGHPDWRKASMERRNQPTSINYRKEGNNGVDYADAALRGMQVRQPFTGNNGENTLVFHIPTSGFTDVVFRFAAKDEGAAEALVADYSVGEDIGNWVAEGMKASTLELADDYVGYEIDFTDVEDAGNNPWFRIRIRFAGDNMEADDGNRVTFNNVSLEGIPVGDVVCPPEVVSDVTLIKAVEHGEPLMIDVKSMFEAPSGNSLEFSAKSARPEVLATALNDEQLELTPLKRGDAQVTVSAHTSNHPAAEHTFRVLVYPEAHRLQGNDFVFSSWDANQQELQYPENMLFLQSGTDDPGIDDPLLYPYFIAHNDYHSNDLETIGFPYNNTGRSRINGLGDDGISFINTGRGRDLGGALLALNTKGTDNAAVQWKAGTLIQNSRVYALRLQYRVGTSGRFHDVIFNGKVSQYLTGDPGHTEEMPAVRLPAEVMGQEYVQLLWRYYHIYGDSGPRAQLRLDDLVVRELADDDDLDIPGLPGGNEIRVFPNPAVSIVHISSVRPVESVEVYTISGQLVDRLSGGKEMTSIPVGHLDTGMYFLRIVTHDAIQVFKIQIHQ